MWIIKMLCVAEYYNQTKQRFKYQNCSNNCRLINNKQWGFAIIYGGEEVSRYMFKQSMYCEL